MRSSGRPLRPFLLGHRPKRYKPHVGTRDATRPSLTWPRGYVCIEDVVVFVAEIVLADGSRELIPEIRQGEPDADGMLPPISASGFASSAKDGPGVDSVHVLILILILILILTLEAPRNVVNLLVFTALCDMYVTTMQTIPIRMYM